MFGMKGLKTALGVVRFGNKKWHSLQKYKLTKDLIYCTKAGIIITVPKGFITNFATWVKPRGRYDVASVVHDYLYSPDGIERYNYTRHGADKLFNEMMRRGGCSQKRINMMYYGVRCFGWWAYYLGGSQRG
jgi:hypothetical protein